MKRSWLLSLLVAAALVSLNMPAFAQSDSMEDLNAAVGNLTNKVNALEKKGPSVEIHGFVQADMINDSTQSFNETVGDGAVKQNGSVAGDNGWTQFSERNSRVDFLAKDNVGGWDTKGYLELDLLGYDPGPVYAATAGVTTSATVATGVSEYKFYTQPTVRLRHAYLQADNDGWTILAGQWWSLFGWNMDYVLATVAEAPVMATLYERTPQLRVMKTFGDDKGIQLQVAGDLEKPDEVGGQVPNINFGLRLVMNDIKGRFCSSTGAGKLMPLSIGLSERNSLISYDTQAQGGGAGFNNNQSQWGSGLAADVLLPVLPAAEGKDDPSIVLTGEWTAGAGDVDQFNGGGFNGGLAAISSGSLANLDPGIIGTSTADASLQLVQIQSINGQIQIFLPPSIGTIFTAGYGEIFSPNVVGLGGSWNDDRVMFINAMQDVTKEIRVGLEYSTFDTHYTTAFGGLKTNDAIDNRVQLSTWYRF